MITADLSMTFSRIDFDLSRLASSQLLRTTTSASMLGPDGLIDNWTSGPTPRLSPDQLAEFAKIVEVGPNREVDGVVRWRRIDLKRFIPTNRRRVSRAAQCGIADVRSIAHDCLACRDGSGHESDPCARLW